MKVWLIYVAILALLYMVLPVTLEWNWLEFFEPVRKGYLPYIDFHVGYPPIGFLTYLPFALLSNFKLTTFVVLMRTINAFFLAMSVLLTYFIARAKGLKKTWNSDQSEYFIFLGDRHRRTTVMAPL